MRAEAGPSRAPSLGTSAGLRSAQRPRLQGPGAAVTAFLLSRLVVLAGLVPALWGPHPGAGPWPGLPPADRLTSVLSRWDGAWYLWVAAGGYPNGAHLTEHLSDVAFFPAFPAVVRATSVVTRLPLPVSAVLVSTAMGAASTVVLWYLAARIADRTTADRAVLIYVLFPGSFVLSMAYAEGLMILAAGACLLFLLDRRWLLAGLSATVATASRPNATAVLVACAVVAVVAVVQHREWRALAAPVIGSLGVAGFHTFLWIHTGQASAWFRSEHEKWHDRPVPPTRAVASLVTSAVRDPIPSLQSGRLNALVGMVGLALVVAGLLLLARAWLPLPVLVYTAAALLVPLTSDVVGPRPRMLIAAFPLAIVIASKLRARQLATFLALSAVGLFLTTLVISTTLAMTP
jgi:hypothetical protein